MFLSMDRSKFSLQIQREKYEVSTFHIYSCLNIEIWPNIFIWIITAKLISSVITSCVANSVMSVVHFLWSTNHVFNWYKWSIYWLACLFQNIIKLFVVNECCRFTQKRGSEKYQILYDRTFIFKTYPHKQFLMLKGPKGPWCFLKMR